MDLKDTKSVISLNFLKGAGLKCPINHYEWRTPISTNQKIPNFYAFVKGDWWIWRVQAVRDVAVDRTGQKAIDCCCYRSQPAHPLRSHRCLVLGTLFAPVHNVYFVQYDAPVYFMPLYPIQ